MTKAQYVYLVVVLAVLCLVGGTIAISPAADFPALFGLFFAVAFLMMAEQEGGKGGIKEGWEDLPEVVKYIASYVFVYTFTIGSSILCIWMMMDLTWEVPVASIILGIWIFMMVMCSLALIEEQLRWAKFNRSIGKPFWN